MFSIPLSFPSSILTLDSRIAGTEPDRELALPTFKRELAEMRILGLDATGLSACMLSRSSAEIWDAVSAFLFTFLPGFDEAAARGCGVLFSASEDARRAERIFKAPRRALPS